MFNLNLKRILAFALASLCMLSLASCDKDVITTDDIPADTPVLTIGDETVTYDEYKYFLNNQKLYTDGGDNSYWANNEGAAEKAKEDALNSLAQFKAIKKLAAENNVTVTQEQEAANKENVDMYISAYGEEEFEKMLADDFLTLELYNEIMHTLTLDTNLYEALVANNTLETDEAAIKANISENYVRAMHILYADEATAAGVLEQAKAASDEEFYNLAQNAEDPGMKGNTEGYVFTKGQMVLPFEEATYALEVGATSELVKSDFGYHIIRKLELTDEYIDEHYSELAKTDLMNAYYEYVDEYAKQLCADAKFEKIYDAITIEAIIASDAANAPAVDSSATDTSATDTSADESAAA